METALAVVVFIGIFVVIFGLRALTGKASQKIGEKAHQAMNKGDMRRQKELWDRTWTWASAVEWSDIRTALDQELAGVADALPGLKVVAEGDSTVRVGFSFTGVRLSQGAIHFGGVAGARQGGEYEFQGDLSKADDKVEFQFTQVKTLNGVARCVSEMEQLLALVERTVKTVDPAAGEVEP